MLEVFCLYMHKVYIFWEGHKILRNLHRRLALHRTNLRCRFRKILWPSQNIWILFPCQNRKYRPLQLSTEFKWYHLWCDSMMVKYFKNVNTRWDTYLNCKDWFIEKVTRHSSVLLLSLVTFFMNQSLNMYTVLQMFTQFCLFLL